MYARTPHTSIFNKLIPTTAGEGGEFLIILKGMYMYKFMTTTPPKVQKETSLLIVHYLNIPLITILVYIENSQNLCVQQNDIEQISDRRDMVAGFQTRYVCQ